MRTREEIKESYKDIIVPAGSEVVYNLLFEILLDIRDVLGSGRKDKLEEKLYNEITEARKTREEERKEEIRQRLE